MTTEAKFTYGPDRGAFKPDIQWELITPTRARNDLDALLTYEKSRGITVTRKIFPTRVDKYKRDMEAGKWFGETSTPVIYHMPQDTVIELLDNAFHRYTAIVQLGDADPTYEGEYMSVLYNPRPGALIPVDTGRRSSLGDLFSKNGKSNSAVLGQAAPLYVAWLDRRDEIARVKHEHTSWLRAHRGQAPSAYKQRQRNKAGTRAYQFIPLGQNKVTHTEAMSLIDAHPELIPAVQKSVSLLGSNSQLSFLSAGVVAWLQLALRADEVMTSIFHSRRGSDDPVVNFFEQVITGPDPYLRTNAAGLNGTEYMNVINPTGNPAITLHERIRTERERRRGKNNGLSAPEQVKLIIPAWDAYRTGETRLKIMTLGSKARSAEA